MTNAQYTASQGQLRGYLAVPEAAGPWPGVVVIHEAFGLTDDIRRVADQIAARGYLAFAPDLFSYGFAPACLVATMRNLVRGGGGRTLADIDAARRHVLNQPGCSGKVGIIGFCMGGGFAILAAGHGYDVAAPNYGVAPKDLRSALRGCGGVVASYAGKDAPPLKKVAGRLTATLTELDIDHDVKVYDDAAHGFMVEHTGRWAFADRVPGLGYHARNAEHAWQRVFAFFDEHLRG